MLAVFANPWIFRNDIPKVAVVLVNWRQSLHTLKAIKALKDQTIQPLIVVVDNDSNDESVSLIKEKLPKNAMLVVRNINGGFGSGSNSGIEMSIAAGAEYIWLLNNDALPEYNCLEKMLEVFSKQNSIAIVGANIKDTLNSVADHAGSFLNCITFTCRTTLSEKVLNESKYAWITGASMLIAVSALKKVGFFDENYFMYWEDADLCSRMRHEGYTFGIATDAIVYHSAGTSSDHMRLKRYEWHYRSQIRWINKHYRLKFYGKIAVSMRHLIKSALTLNWTRFFMSLKLTWDIWS